MAKKQTVKTSKKSEDITEVYNNERLVSAHDKKQLAAEKQTKKKAPASLAQVVKGSHLTVITDAQGRTTLEWDDAALARDVREAIEAYESAQTKPAAKKATARKKKVQ